ncbi:MAG: toll/interleukin-1 receptor domain-containing protein [Bacteroidota bacterium]
MADQALVELLKEGFEVWNAWRYEDTLTKLDLRYAGLGKRSLRGYNLEGVDLSRANFAGSFLHGVNFDRVVADGAVFNNLIARDCGFVESVISGSSLVSAEFLVSRFSNAKIMRCNMVGARMRHCDFRGADFSNSNLTEADLYGSDLSGCNLSRVVLHESSFVDVDLSSAVGLENCMHAGPSVIDFRTLSRSGPLPDSFLRGVGLSDEIIKYLPGLVGSAIEFYSCFISHSTADGSFAKRLHNDLQGNGVRCWYAPEDMKSGRKIHEQIYEAIRMHEKLLLVLSEHSMTSNWVQAEIRRARKHEREEGRRLLFPVSLCSYDELKSWELFDADEGCDLAAKIREYYIPDFSEWRNHDAYQLEFEKLLASLRAA